MLFRQLEYFVALARERHFARAAAACYVSQPALSEAIRKLEQELKVPLVQRSRTFEGLTPEGERLVLWARRILANHEQLQQEVVALQTGLTGQMHLGVIPNSAATVALLTDPYCAEHPLVKVQIQAGLTSAQIIERVQRHELDAGIIYPHGQDATGLTVVPLYFEEQVLLAGSDLLTGQSTSISWLDVVELPLCLLNTGMRGRQLIDEALATKNLIATPQAEADSVSTLFGRVATGRWATVIPSTWLKTLRPPVGTRVLRLEDPSVSAMVALVLSAIEPIPMPAQALADTARKIQFDAAIKRPVDPMSV
ncbi:LysR family transcriptional regulator [Nocardia tengchongensis]|uniref:LysR family transcriptional regulator n=1 Tax=Nocardia tengchongensis TaxID=2055889 RepID=UPI0036B7CFD9